MRISQLIAPLSAAAISALPLGRTAYAELLIKVDKTAQRMTVSVNGEQLYNWPVTTGASGYDTPGGTFKPFRMEIDHYSDEYDNAPMPYSIFFTQTGNAIHGNYGNAILVVQCSAGLRAAVGEERRYAVESGEAGEDG